MNAAPTHMTCSRDAIIETVDLCIEQTFKRTNKMFVTLTNYLKNIWQTFDEHWANVQQTMFPQMFARCGRGFSSFYMGCIVLKSSRFNAVTPLYQITVLKKPRLDFKFEKVAKQNLPPILFLNNSKF